MLICATLKSFVCKGYSHTNLNMNIFESIVPEHDHKYVYYLLKETIQETMQRL